ncbi:hypothetical protein HPT25_23560 [Bacillus sp. BRMEA1]|uniref:hypothetical protein n=1 Tax=Neobacillus endophyticus TaxID=2738405 RepID=UPI00156431FE|nr:hypothetical protein [Neobacillus endophyticus]NRD80303.1 hypothetical protein [Neobacillus endophyticus]
MVDEHFEESVQERSEEMKLWFCTAVSMDCEPCLLVVAETEEKAFKKFEDQLEEEGLWWASLHVHEILEVDGYRIAVIEDVGQIPNNARLKRYTVLYYNRFANENQLWKIEAKNEFRAGREFYRKHSRKKYHDCIEQIYED